MAFSLASEQRRALAMLATAGINDVTAAYRWPLIADGPSAQSMVDITGFY